MMPSMRTYQSVDKAVERLRNKIQEDGWIGEPDDSLERDLEELLDRRDVENLDAWELVRRFEEGWEETLHFEHHYRKPLEEAIREKMIAQGEFEEGDDPIIIYEEAHRILKEEIWDAYHKEYGTYERAEEVLEAHEKEKVVA